MENFTIFDDYIRYPVLEGETTQFEEITYNQFKEAHTKAIAFAKIEDKRWTDRVIEWCKTR